jgi:hypothetical protein
MPSPHNTNDCLVRLTGRWSEGEMRGEIDDHYADAVSINLALVTNTPGDHIPLASIWVTVFGDGFFLVSRTRVGGDSEYLASGSIDALEGTRHYGSSYRALHHALWEK